jgi:hypothetical protein
MRYSAKSIIAVIGFTILVSACQGHYNPRLHVDEAPAKPGHVKQKYYH